MFFSKVKVSIEPCPGGAHGGERMLQGSGVARESLAHRAVSETVTWKCLCKESAGAEAAPDQPAGIWPGSCCVSRSFPGDQWRNGILGRRNSVEDRKAFSVAGTV